MSGPENWRRSSGGTLKALKSISETVEYKAGETIYAIGGPQKWLWGVQKGQVQILIALAEAEPILGHMYHQGSWFGESELIQSSDGFVEARAAEPTTMTRIPFSRFRALANDEPELWKALLLLTSQTQLLAMSAGNDQLLDKPRKRLAANLLRLCGMRGNFQQAGSANEIWASQQDIANLSNITRPKASVHLNTFRDAGLVELRYGRIRITDPRALERVVDLNS